MTFNMKDTDYILFFSNKWVGKKNSLISNLIITKCLLVSDKSKDYILLKSTFLLNVYKCSLNKHAK